MHRILICATCLFVVSALPGCMGGARVIRQDAASGVVVIPENTNVFPTYYQNAAVEAIRREHGPNVEIAWGKGEEVVVGQETRNEQVVDRRVRGDDKKPGGELVKNTNVTTTTDKKEYRLEYRVSAPGSFNSGLIQTGGLSRPLNGGSNGLSPTGGAPVRNGLSNQNSSMNLDPVPTGLGSSPTFGNR
jgi:hypothetical protein